MKPWGIEFAAGILLAAPLMAQALPAFEVASVRVHSFESADHVGPPIAGNRLTVGGNLYQLVMYAYDLKIYQVSGGPAWVTHPSTEGDYYEISAKAAGEETLTPERARLSMQALLADRFHLKLHPEQKEMPVYALVVGRGGPKFKESAPDATTRSVGSVSVTTVTSTFTKSPLAALVRVLSGAAGRPVMDRTGLAGFYDYKLEFARDPVAAASETDALSMFTAVQEQLGLKLESDKAPVEVFVIDRAERPSAN